MYFNVLSNRHYTIEKEHAGKTLLSRRYCVVCAIVLYLDPILGWMILLNKRGSGTPDFQHMWNIPCGYIEANETAQEACSREVLEKCHVKVNPKNFNLLGVETNPKICNNGNITLRFLALTNTTEFVNINIIGEENDIDDVSWFELDKAKNLELAFNHKDVITFISNNINYGINMLLDVD